MSLLQMKFLFAVGAQTPPLCLTFFVSPRLPCASANNIAPNLDSFNIVPLVACLAFDFGTSFCGLLFIKRAPRFDNAPGSNLVPLLPVLRWLSDLSWLGWRFVAGSIVIALCW